MGVVEDRGWAKYGASLVLRPELQWAVRLKFLGRGRGGGELPKGGNSQREVTAMAPVLLVVQSR